MNDFRKKLMKKQKQDIAYDYANDGRISFFGTKLGYAHDTMFPEGMNFVLYSSNSTDEYYFVGNFQRLYKNESGEYFIYPTVNIARWQGSLDDYQTALWTQYSNRNIGTEVTFYSVPVYSVETGDLLGPANYNEADYY